MPKPVTPERIAEFRARLEARLEELRRMETLGEESRKPVELDQSAQGRLSRMDALHQLCAGIGGFLAGESSGP